MALDPLRSLAATASPSKATRTASSGASGAASFEAALASSSGGASGNAGATANSGSNGVGASANPGVGTGHRARTSAATRSGRDVGSSTNTTGASHGDSGANSSNEAGASSDSSSDSSNSNAKRSGKDSGSPAAASKPGTSPSKTRTASATAAAASAGPPTPAGTNQQSNTPATTFLDALAQTQTDAAQSAAAAASATAAIAAPADAGDVTAPTNGKAKNASDKDSDADAASSLAVISQSLAAAIVSVQQPAPAQAIATTGSAATEADMDTDATEVVSMGSGSSAAVQKLVTTLANDRADGLKAAADANGGTSGFKSDTPASTAPAADGGSAAVSAFQAQMSISSHFQQPPAQDSNANRVNAPIGSPAFNDELGGKITWLANQGIQSASVQLSPEHMGPVSVHISVQAGSASVSFNAAHADTRAALEQALPRLREMFATNGLTLSDANVSHQSPRGQGQKQSISAIGAASRGASEEATSSTVTAVAVGRLGLVDTYA